MEIINSGKPKKPPFTAADQERPSFKTTRDEDAWVDLILKRCMEGYNGLAPDHYGYLMLGSIKLVDGSIIRPFWRDWDHKIEWISHDAKAKGDDEGYVKRREYGLTSRFAGWEPVKNSLFHPGSINIMTSADSFRCRSMFSEKTMVVYDNLQYRLPERFIPKRKFKNRTGYLELERGQEFGGAGSQVEMIETADSDNAAKKPEGYRAFSIFLDEWFLHPRSPIVLSSSQASVKQGFVKKGHIILGGSCGAETEAEAQAMRSNADVIETTIRDADKIGLRVTFIPGTACIDFAPETDKDGIRTGKIIPFMENGYSLENKAKEWILKERLKLEKAVDKTRYWTFVKNYPLSLEEVFEINKMGVLPEIVYSKLEIAKLNIQTAPKVKHYIMTRDADGKAKANETKSGDILIARHPNHVETNIAGIDPIPFSGNKLEDGSDYAIAIKSRENQTYDAYYAIRSHDEDVVVEQSILLQEYYWSQKFLNGAPAMLETNMGGVVRRLYKELKKDYLLADRPEILGSVFIDGNVVKGWYKNAEKSGPLAIADLINYLKQYAHLIAFDRLIKEVRAFPKANTDLLDAVVSCEIYDKALFAKEKKQSGAGKSLRPQLYYDYENGRVVKKYRFVEISE